jgi:hypothetical protein
MAIDGGDIADDMAGGAWLTYGQLADARGISRRAAIRLTQRHRWRRQKGNDGFARVWVPDDMTTPRGDDTATADADADDDTATDRATPFHAQALAALEDALAALRAAKDSEIATLRDVVEGLRSTVSRAEHRAAHAEQRATDAEAARDQARAEATDAARAADDLRQREAAWWRQGRLRRVLAAWRGQ